MTVDTTTIPSRPEAISARVAELVQGFRSRVPVSESQRSVPAESIDELVNAGLARMLVPSEHGGLDLTIRAAVDIVFEVSRGCASTGWVSWLMMHVPHVVAMFPAEAQAAVWAQGPDVVTAGSHFGMTVEKVGDGYRISGRAPFTSGVNNADWVYVGGPEDPQQGPASLRYFLLHRSQYTIADTWDTVGMRGTGSNTVVVDDVFVAEAFTLRHVDAREGTTPGGALSASTTMHVPWVATGSLGFVAAMLGAAQAAYDDVVSGLAGRTAPSGFRIAGSQSLQVDVGKVSVKLDAARTLLRALADRADAGGDFTLAERAQLTATSTLVAGLVVEAVDEVLVLAGTSGFGATAVAQQSWRDVHFAAAHISLNKRETYGRYGRSAMAVEDKTPGMFF